MEMITSCLQKRTLKMFTQAKSRETLYKLLTFFRTPGFKYKVTMRQTRVQCQFLPPTRYPAMAYFRDDTATRLDSAIDPRIN